MNSKERINKIDIPSYTFKQEIFNSVSHFLGIPMGIVIIIISFILRFLSNLRYEYFVSLIAFGISIIFLYFVSGIYHFTDPKIEKRKKILRILDHSTIYILIAGTYTPICVYLLLNNYNIGLVMLVVEWGLAILGASLNIIDFNNKFVKGISMFLYLALGWLILFTGGFIHLPYNSFNFILLGGILYTIGSILYGIGHKNLTFHSIFHIFVLCGTFVQSIGVLSLYN